MKIYTQEQLRKEVELAGGKDVCHEAATVLEAMEIYGFESVTEEEFDSILVQRTTAQFRSLGII